MDSRTKQRIDKALRMNAELEATLGIDSTKEERANVKERQRKNLEFVKKYDEDFFNRMTVS